MEEFKRNFCTITKASHHFVVRNPTPQITQIIYRLCEQYTQFAKVFDKVRKKNIWQPVKTYGLYVDEGREFRLHIGQFREFQEQLDNQYIPPASYKVVEKPMYEAADVELKVKEGWELYPQQREAVDFVTDYENGNNRSPMVMMPTGSGKGCVSMFAASELGKRLAVMVLGGYTQKWKDELLEIYDITEKDLVEVKGADILQRCTSFPSSKLPIPKVFVISINTMKSWYKLYEENINHPGLEAYDCKPDDFFEHLGIGTVIYDEVHQHPHAVYQANCYMHVPKSVELSATLLSEDPILHKIQSVMFPHFKRFDKVKMKKYITSHACGYQIVDYASSKIQTTEFGSNMYSHVAFERSMLKHKKLRGQYLDMIVDLAERVYYKKKVAEDKLAIFVSSRIMADALLERVKERFPDLDSRIYMQGSPLADAIDPDIRITTIISAGTALDIPNLRHTIMTINVKSPISNAQCLGRLREMKHRTENKDVHFWYTYCTTIPKQVDYHRNKIDLFKDRVIEQKDHFLATLYPY